ncbi:MAG TPA: catalase-peroxidase, partial [Chitinophagaceae bacterium]|nr:catalase-peroxidase [Chitinophagaceae bacterium]
HSDKRGGANGARIRLEPQRQWEVNQPERLQKVLTVMEQIQTSFHQISGAKKISLADLIVLGGCAAVEQAAKNAGYMVNVPFTPGRTDATQEQTDAESFAVLEPKADAFRNYLKGRYEVKAEELMVDKAQLMNLTAKEMTVLLGGMRMLNTNYDQSTHGVFTTKKDQLTNDFFIHLLQPGLQWKPLSEAADLFEAKKLQGEGNWTATRVDLIFGSNAELRALAEVYASDDAGEKFVRDFIAAWNKVMNLDRFDL